MAAGRSPGLARRAPEAPRPAVLEDCDQPGHTHRLPRALLLTLVIICVGLLASIVLVATLARQAQHQAEMTNHRLEALEGFIADRGVERDQQYTTLDERITAAVCDLLDQLPAGPVLDPVRGKYACGPGLPTEALSPEAQQQLQRYAEPAPAEPTPVVKPRQPAPETTDAPTPAPTVAPPAVAADEPEPSPVAPATPAATASAPAPAAPPLVDLSPATEPVCNLLHVCL